MTRPKFDIKLTALRGLSGDRTLKMNIPDVTIASHDGRSRIGLHTLLAEIWRKILLAVYGPEDLAQLWVGREARM